MYNLTNTIVESLEFLKNQHVMMLQTPCYFPKAIFFFPYFSSLGYQLFNLSPGSSMASDWKNFLKTPDGQIQIRINLKQT